MNASLDQIDWSFLFHPPTFFPLLDLTALLGCSEGTKGPGFCISSVGLVFWSSTSSTGPMGNDGEWGTTQVQDNGWTPAITKSASIGEELKIQTETKNQCFDFW